MQQHQKHEAYHMPDGQKVQLGQRIAQGGEGAVYEIKDDPNIVAKIYHKGKRPLEIESKLKHMVDYPPRGRVHDTIAWPMSRLVGNQDGETHGYLMKRAAPGAIPASVFTSKKLRKQHREISQKNREETQALMAEIIVKYANTMQSMHDAGYAIGDVNDKNLLAWPDGRILVLDADSFQTPAPHGTNYRCRVGRPEYQAPEILKAMSVPCQIVGCPEGPVGHGAVYGCFDREPNHDLFSLGILAYQALCDGRHPYSGRLKANAQPAQKSTDRIKLGYFPFHRHGQQYVQPSREQTLEWKALTQNLRNYFQSTFEYR